MQKNTQRKVGLAPGTVVYTGEKKKGPLKIRVIDYTPDKVTDTYISNLSELKKYLDSDTVSWINVIGVHHSEMIEKIGNIFGLDTLFLEDIANVHGRPKLDVRDGLLFTQLKMIYPRSHGKLVYEQLSLVLGKKFVLTFQEEDLDIFDPVRQRIKGSHWRIRKLDSDYLAYALLDAVVDNYFAIMEKIGVHIDKIDDAIVKGTQENSLDKIHKTKKDLVLLRRYIWPVREIIDRMKKTDSLIQADTHKFIDDLYDHVIQVIDSIEIYREMTGGILETYLSHVSNKMNEIMKVLTIISTIFIPLTFITGLYGMNFKYMPELAWKYSYPLVWIFMLGIAFFLFKYFHKKKWL